MLTLYEQRRNKAILERMEAHRKLMDSLPPEERKKEAIKLLVATGMYNDDGTIKEKLPNV
jgi:hypothetical protein